MVRTGTTYWVTLRKSRLEAEDLLLVVINFMLSVLGLTKISPNTLNCWLAR